MAVVTEVVVVGGAGGGACEMRGGEGEESAVGANEV